MVISSSIFSLALPLTHETQQQQQQQHEKMMDVDTTIASCVVQIPPQIVIDQLNEQLDQDRIVNQENERPRSNSDSLAIPHHPSRINSNFILHPIPHSCAYHLYQLRVPSNSDNLPINHQCRGCVSCPNSLNQRRKHYEQTSLSNGSISNSLNEEIMVQKLTANHVSDDRISPTLTSTSADEPVVTPYANSDPYDSVSLDPSYSSVNIYAIPNCTKRSSLENGDVKIFGTSEDYDKISSAETFPGRITPKPTDEKVKREAFKKCLTVILSCTYAIFIFMLGIIVYVTDLFQNDSTIDEVFNIFLTFFGLLWIVFLHFDIRKMVNRRRKIICPPCSISNNNGTYSPKENESRPSSAQQEYRVESRKEFVNLPYYFRTGRHSGSFYLKIGAAAFCFGHLIHEGLLLSRQLIYLTSKEDFYRETCFRLLTLILDIIHPIFSFYQLFMIFKYSNVVINRFREVSRFALMHIIATNLCFWVHTIIRETTENMQQKLHGTNETKVEGGIRFVKDLVQFLNHNLEEEKMNQCVSKQVLSHFTINANPYLYPFTIEYSLLLVGVWFVIWHNVGRSCPKSETVSRLSDSEEQTDNYMSNLVIHVDCHSANRGLFAGLLVLLVTVISVIIFFVAVMNEEYIQTGILINNISDLVLLVIMSLSVAVAYRQTSKLDINLHAVSFLDDTLLFIALPCFFLYGIFGMLAGINAQNIFSIVSGVLSIVQVTLQTPFIIDGLRRCSNSQLLRYQKPGRELITFLIVCNLAVWVLETFEIKSYEAHIDKFQFYGKILWIFLSHITVPLTLFYRFHSSVCLVDIWKSAYEHGD